MVSLCFACTVIPSPEETVATVQDQCHGEMEVPGRLNITESEYVDLDDMVMYRDAGSSRGFHHRQSSQHTTPSVLGCLMLIRKISPQINNGINLKKRS